MPADLQKARALFLHAVGKLPPEQWEAYVAEACGGDADLQRQVEHLLQVHREAGSFLEEPAIDPRAMGAFPDAPGDDRPAVGPREGPGTVIGPYKLLQQIGEGGMGVVWMAEQTHPVQRMVAVKVIKPGMDSRQVIARFEAERQALALMDHVNIARVLDVGATEAGLPYFVMELVHGVPITRYCDDHRLTPRERLELFVPVCQAIQHAHQKGIIHRDLKPSNVLITLYDGRPVPKVIDFGVAKALSQKLTERTLFTQYGTLVGTLEYMSPEQAEMSALGVDTRSDIFSLGVLLYELLTGSTPLNRQRFKEAAYAEILRLIKEEEPPKPSTRLTESKDSLASICAQRQTEPAKLTKLVRGELDWIVMRALEKDRNRRYETANGFAMDVQRYLADEPVQACPPTAAYRFWKFARKHRKLLLTMTAFALLLLTATGVSIGLAAWAFQAERQSRAAADAERNAKAEEAAQRELAQKNEKEAKAVLGFFQDKVLAAGRPKGHQGGLGKDTTLRNAIDAAEPEITKTFQDQPLVEASIRNALGLSYGALTENGLAIQQYERALLLRKAGLGADHPATLNTMNNLAQAFAEAGKLDQAIPLFEETTRLQKARLGPDHADRLFSLTNLALAYFDFGKRDQAIALHEETLALKKAKLGPDDPSTLMSMNNLAEAYRQVGQLDRAMTLFTETLQRLEAKHGPDHHYTLICSANLAGAYANAGRLDEALPLAEDALRRMQATIGLEHSSTLAAMTSLAAMYQVAGKLEQAFPLVQQTLKLSTAKHGRDHPTTLAAMDCLAAAYLVAGQLDQALPLFEETLKLRTAKLGADHPDTLCTMSDLGNALQTAGKLDLALPMLQDAAAGIEKRRFRSVEARNIVARLISYHETLKRFDQAEIWRRKWLAQVKTQAGADSLPYSVQLVGLGVNLMNQKKWTDAEPLLRESFAIQSMKAADEWTTFYIQSMLGASLAGQQRFAEAERPLLDGYTGLEKRQDQMPSVYKARLAKALERIVQLYDAWGKPDKAAEWRAKQK